LRRMRLAREPTAKVVRAPMRTYQVQAIRGMAITVGCVQPSAAVGVFKNPENKMRPGNCQRVRLSANPVTMPMIAPHWVAREGAEEEDAQQASVRHRSNRQADLDDVALAAGADRVDGDGEEDEGPEDGGGAGDNHALSIVGGGTPAHVEVDDGGGGERVERGG
jgi:hypothetical protein